ncbi:MAG TPA: hypothetical protein DEF88_13285, partial [Porphyromonadaceae bacterium]|nr:hypothetical protein [Porphyromonadaceae bacterium]
EFNNRGILPFIKTQGLDPEKSYKISEINKISARSCFWGDGLIFKGDFLNNVGITLNIARQYESAVFLIEEIGAGE